MKKQQPKNVETKITLQQVHNTLKELGIRMTIWQDGQTLYIVFNDNGSETKIKTTQDTLVEDAMQYLVKLSASSNVVSEPGFESLDGELAADEQL